MHRRMQLGGLRELKKNQTRQSIADAATDLFRRHGYDAVTVYFDWDYSSPSPGSYDFTGVRDMNTFLNLAQQAGLKAIAGAEGAAVSTVAV